VKILVGLGNPGFRYRKTRHNAGFRVIDEVARRLTAKFHTDKKLQAMTARATLEGEEILLVKPLSYMNLSGQVVRDVLRMTCSTVAELVVVVDDVHLATGHLRIRSEGSPGGHNGLKSVQEALGTNAYARVRLGVGSGSATSDDLSDYVLGRFTREQEKVMSAAVGGAADALCAVVRDGAAAAMNTYNKKQ
jgi:PTH1 family peptidyl-tRNA hydrolase